MAEEMFKTTLMGGFDKDDVQEKVQKMKDETAQQQLAFKKEIEEKAYDCVEDALEDFLKGFNGNIDIKL